MIASLQRLRSARPDVAITVAASVAALALSFAGLYWPGWIRVPLTVRFVVGLIVFGAAPGMAVVGPLLLVGRRERISSADFALSVVTCTFSCNLAFNVALFALKWSMTDLTRAYVILQAAAYAIWGAWAWLRQPADPPPAPPRAVGTNRATVLFGLFVAAAACAVTYMTYVNGSPPVNSEELVWLRKLVENPAVRFDNLSFRQGDPSTYLYVPFQILIAGTSIIARADIAFIYSAFWAVTTALSLFIIARLAYVIFGRLEVVALVFVWMIAIAMLDPNTVIYAAGIVVPYPNRYGFAGGVLLPLTLLLFWSILRDPGVHAWRWMLLVYVTVEMTFVHARETLLAVGAMAAVFLIMTPRPARNRRHLAAIAAVVAVSGVVLFAYKHVNLGLAPDLDTFVGEMTVACRLALSNLIAEHGRLGALMVATPSYAVVNPNGTNALTVSLATYQDLFVETWARSYLGRLFLPVTLLALPFYSLAARSIAELSLAVVLAGLGAVVSSGVLTLLMSAAVGNPEILIAYNLIFLVSLFVFCGAAWAAGVAVANRAGASVAGRALLAGGCAALLAAAYIATDRIAAFRPIAATHWTSGLAWALIGATAAAIAYRTIRGDLPLFADVRPEPPLGAIVGVCLVLAVLMPAIRTSTAWSKNPFTPAYPAFRFTGDLARDYPLLTAARKFDPSDYPFPLIEFLRASVPANQTILTADALSLLQRVPHFAAVLSNRGVVASSYITNWGYLQNYSRSGSAFQLGPFFADDDGVALLVKLIDEYHIDIIIVGPGESAAVRQGRDARAALRARLRPAFEQGGYIVYLVDRRTTSAGATN